MADENRKTGDPLSTLRPHDSAHMGLLPVEA